jgi:hypothetical protein
MIRSDQFERRTRGRALLMAVSFLQGDVSQAIVPSCAASGAGRARSGVGTLQILYDPGRMGQGLTFRRGGAHTRRREAALRRG